jgi:ribonuclease R
MTDAELRAVSAERRIENLYKAIYMSKYVGELFHGYVSSVGQFGVFVMADNTCEGLIPMSELPYGCVFDEKNMCVRSRSVRFRPGDRIRVKVEDVDLSRGKIRFSEWPE